MLPEVKYELPRKSANLCCKSMTGGYTCLIGLTRASLAHPSSVSALWGGAHAALVGAEVLHASAHDNSA